MTGVELAYWAALGGGLGLLLLALLLGDVFNFLDFEIGGSDFAGAPVFFAAVAAFGAGGLIGLKAFEFGTGGSIYLGLGTGLGMGGLTALLFAVLRGQEAGEGFDLAQLVGERGRCTVAVGPGVVGRVAVPFAGMTRSLVATGDGEVRVGEEVVVRAVVGKTVVVARPSASP